MTTSYDITNGGEGVVTVESYERI
jgi:hypothetical protein